MQTRSDRIDGQFRPRKPRIVGVVASRVEWEAVAKGDCSGLDLCELRMDLLVAEGFAEDECRRELPFPKILTIRDPREGGGDTLEEDERLNLFQRLLPHVDYIDVELRNFNRYSDLLATANLAGKNLIVSVHDFEKTPSKEMMERWVEETAARQPAAIFKIAARVSSWEEMARLADFLVAQRPMRTAAMGIGSFGKISRLLFAQLGSELIYAACEKPVIPGQWDFRALRSILRQINDAD
jgi:3-dehydroquinate dehydratase-1